MAKYKKEEVHMIDMSGRLKMKVIHEEFTSEDEEEWENEMREMYIKIEQHMQRYEEHIKEMFTSAYNNPNINYTEKNDEYFIKTYGDKFIGRNPDNIKHRIDLFNKYIKEQD